MLLKFKQKLIKAFEDEIDNCIINHKVALPRIKGIRKEVSELNNRIDKQSASLQQKKDLICNEESYVKMKKYIKYINEKEYNNNENHIEQDRHKNQINEYMTLSKDQQKDFETKLSRDFSADKDLLSLRWPSNNELLQKLSQITKHHADVYLNFDH